jgi:hypothetical protein
MLQRFASLALLSTIAIAQSPVVLDQAAELQTGVNAGNNISELQTLAPMSLNIFGYGLQAAVPNRLVDQFTVNSAMIIDGIEGFGYATGVLTPACTAVQLSLFDGNPSTGTPNQLLPGAGNGVNLIGAAGYTVTNTLTNIWRVTSTAQTTLNRNIQSVRVDFAPIVLLPGTYYLSIAFTGLNFCPPLTTLNQRVTGDGLQAQGATPVWVALANGTITPNGQGVPFRLFGTVGTPGSIANLGGGIPSGTLNVDGTPNVGGYIRAELSTVNPLTVGAIIVGLTPPQPFGVPVPLGCGAVWHANPDALIYTGIPGGAVSWDLQIPVVASLQGATLFVQGAEIDITSSFFLPCDLGGGFQFTLTNGYVYTINQN